VRTALLTNQITTADFLLQIEYTVFGIFVLPNVNAQPNLIFGSEFKLMINNGLDGCSQIDPGLAGKLLYKVKNHPQRFTRAASSAF
jgi:hypothetical protein